jgi:hypothetical protein
VLALAVMAAAIVSHDRWFLNFVHVICGVLWTGIDLFMGFVMGPILRRVDISVRREIIIRLVPKTLFLMPTLSIITGTTGWFLAEDLGYLDLPWPRLGRRGARPRRADDDPGHLLSVADQSHGVPRTAPAQSGYRLDQPQDAQLLLRGGGAGNDAGFDDHHHGALRVRDLVPPAVSGDPGRKTRPRPVRDRVGRRRGPALSQSCRNC